jgi:hypothetical protein
MADTNKRSWLTYGAVGETLADVPLARWQPFADDAAAQGSPVYEGYAFAAIADAPGGKPRMQWTEEDGWVGNATAEAVKPANKSTVYPAWNERAMKDVTPDDDTAVTDAH